LEEFLRFEKGIDWRPPLTLFGWLLGSSALVLFIFVCLPLAIYAAADVLRSVPTGRGDTRFVVPKFAPAAWWHEVPRKEPERQPARATATHLWNSTASYVVRIVVVVFVGAVMGVVATLPYTAGRQATGLPDRGIPLVGPIIGVVVALRFFFRSIKCGRADVQLVPDPVQEVVKSLGLKSSFSVLRQFHLDRSTRAAVKFAVPFACASYVPSRCCR
jgi:hypothetical protein